MLKTTRFGVIVFFAYGITTTPLIGIEIGLSDIAAKQTQAETELFKNSQHIRFVYARERIEKITDTKGSGGRIPVEWTLARRGDEWYSSRLFLKPFNTPDLSIPAEPITNITSSTRTLDWTPFNHQCIINPEETGGFNTFEGWQYAELLGLNVYRYILGADGKRYLELLPKSSDDARLAPLRRQYFPSAIQAPDSKYVIKNAEEMIDGQKCVVLEAPGYDRAWLDPAIGFAVRKRQVYFGPGQPLEYDVHNEDFRQVKSGVWLPWRQTVDHYAIAKIEDKVLWNKVAERTFNQVKELVFDVPQDSLFEPKLPVGTLVNDFINKNEYRVADASADPFDAALQEAAAITPRPRAHVYGIVGTVALIVVLLFLIWRRRSAGIALIFFVLTLTSVLPSQAKTGSSEKDVLRHQNRTQRSAPSTTGEVEARTKQAEWNWMPTWRDKGDCGPNALYVVSRLLGQPVSLAQVKAQCPFDATLGCSIEDLVRASASLGCPCEARFVVPNDLRDMRPPFILHGVPGVTAPTGHFIVIVGHNPANDNFAIIDPVREAFSWHKSSSILKGYSGYILVPKPNWIVGHVHPTITNSVLIAGIAIGIAVSFRPLSQLFARFKTPRTPGNLEG